MLALLCLFASPGVHDCVMSKETMAQAFATPLTVGDKDTALPVWPNFKQDLTSTPLVGYAFESIDLAPIPGFSGTPFNLLFALNANGKFMDVQVLSQREPVFLEGLGPEPSTGFSSNTKRSRRQGKICARAENSWRYFKQKARH